MMKSKKSVFIEGHILSKSCHGQAGQPFCIHRVRFSNGKYAIIREVSGICFKTGEIIQRNDCEWFYKLTKIRLFLLSTLRMMNQEDNFLNINDKPMNL